MQWSLCSSLGNTLSTIWRRSLNPSATTCWTLSVRYDWTSCKQKHQNSLKAASNGMNTSESVAQFIRRVNKAAAAGAAAVIVLWAGLKPPSCHWATYGRRMVLCFWICDRSDEDYWMYEGRSSRTMYDSRLLPSRQALHVQVLHEMTQVELHRKVE